MNLGVAYTATAAGSPAPAHRGPAREGAEGGMGDMRRAHPTKAPWQQSASPFACPHDPQGVRRSRPFASIKGECTGKEIQPRAFALDRRGEGAQRVERGMRGSAER
jgi:hypothetical protein